MRLRRRGRSAAGAPVDMTEEQLDGYIDDLLNDEAAQVTPPDRLLSYVLEWPPGTEAGFKKWLASLPSRLVRAKGLVRSRRRVSVIQPGEWELDYCAVRRAGAETRGR